MTAKKKKKLSKAGRWILDLILIAALLTAGYSGYRIYSAMHAYQESEQEYTVIRGEVMNSEIKISDYRHDINWEKLQAINPDVVGWISMKDSTIDYPIVQGNDNVYYLNHLINGRESNAGTIFIDVNNSDPFNDRNTVLYGHHMLSDPKMFAELENYENQSYYDTHKTLIIETPDKVYELQVVAGIKTVGTGGYVRLGFENDDAFLNYVYSFTSRSTFTSDVSVAAGDRLILLSTCSYEQNDGRYALLCRINEIEE